MGLPALKHEMSSARTRPHLAPTPGRHTSRGPRPSARQRNVLVSRQRELFTAFVVAVVLLSALGIARVTVAACAAATSMESGRLRKAIKAERLKGDLLEIQQSSLATPGRIQEIAGSTMRMSEAGRVCYIRLDGAEVCVSEPTAGSRTPGNGPAGTRNVSSSSVFTSLLRTALGEAQILLLGDVALASSR